MLHPSPLRPLAARTLLALACLALGVAPLHAGDRTPPKRRPAVTRPAAPPPAAPVAPRVSVAVEPETGALVPAITEPGPGLSAAERTGLMRSSEGLREVRLADGTVMVDLQGRFQEYATVGVGPDGCLRFGCVDDPGVLAWWLWGVPLPTRALPREVR